MRLLIWIMFIITYHAATGDTWVIDVDVGGKFTALVALYAFVLDAVQAAKRTK